MSRYVDVIFNTPLQDSYTYAVAEGADCSIGQRVSVTLGKRKLTGYVIREHAEPPKAGISYKEILRVVDKEILYGEEEIALSSWMASLYLCSQGEALSAMIPGGRKDKSVPVFPPGDDFLDAPRNLTEAQKSALNAVLADRQRIYYLFGVTGSGKTEVFLQSAERVIAEGKQVIYLVPEITLTHQLSDQVMKRFSGRVALLHSALTPSQRLAEWLRIRRGEVDIVIGARSAVFAPFSHLGLIIIDEEHENSYKSGSTPRYHARQVAMHRCSRSTAKLVMGSATPSLEAWHLMKEGKIGRLHLPERVSGGKMPEIEIVDMAGSESAISKRLLLEMRRVIGAGKQVILFLNRRGFSYFFHCRTCGYEMMCDHCSVSLTYHRERNRMICHYCGYQRKPVTVCPECGSLDVGYSGFGTEMVEEEVKRLFPQARIARLDTDIAKKREGSKSILDGFRNREYDILLGTQMVAKGLNFPGVDLVGIVLADSGLHLPDFRAQERTFSLIMQVSGRSGRYSSEGRVIVQTYRPENSAIRLASENAIEQFCEQELEIRKMTRFPPFTRISRAVLRGKRMEKVADAAEQAADLVEQVIDADESNRGTEVLGPSECPLSRISGNYRHQIIIRSASLQVLHRVTAVFSQAFSSPYGVYLEIDIDPVSLL